mmetsp:Transcript_9757/g.19161  ORF Transcript_9757/g.19161 Transcript_9757/m.19161 type:complete len:308 (-) Transcript_9757:35-958(-)
MQSVFCSDCTHLLGSTLDPLLDLLLESIKLHDGALSEGKVITRASSELDVGVVLKFEAAVDIEELFEFCLGNSTFRGDLRDLSLEGIGELLSALRLENLGFLRVEEAKADNGVVDKCVCLERREQLAVDLGQSSVGICLHDHNAARPKHHGHLDLVTDNLGDMTREEGLDVNLTRLLLHCKPGVRSKEVHKLGNAIPCREEKCLICGKHVREGSSATKCHEGREANHTGTEAPASLSSGLGRSSGLRCCCRGGSSGGVHKTTGHEGHTTGCRRGLQKRPRAETKGEHGAKEKMPRRSEDNVRSGIWN